MKEIFKSTLTIQKIEGKGGWTYVSLPFIKNQKNNPFGWMIAEVTIDDYTIENYHLMPMGNGHLFLPIKASVRKHINKYVGDTVFVKIIPIDYLKKVTHLFLASLQHFPIAESNYVKLSSEEKSMLINSLCKLKNQERLIDEIKNKIVQLEKMK
jgi:hypothetical protein